MEILPSTEDSDFNYARAVLGHDHLVPDLHDASQQGGWSSVTFVLSSIMATTHAHAVLWHIGCGAQIEVLI